MPRNPNSKLFYNRSYNPSVSNGTCRVQIPNYIWSMVSMVHHGQLGKEGFSFSGGGIGGVRIVKFLIRWWFLVAVILNLKKSLSRTYMDDYSVRVCRQIDSKHLKLALDVTFMEYSIFAYICQVLWLLVELKRLKYHIKKRKNFTLYVAFLGLDTFSSTCSIF